MVVEWNKAVNPYILGKFAKMEGVGTLSKVDFEDSEKETITRNAIIFGFNQIFNANNVIEPPSIDALSEDDMIPFASRGGYQALNENFRVYLPADINAINIQQNLEIVTKDLLNKSFTLAPGISDDITDYDISDALIKDIQRQPEQYGFLANSANQHQLVYLYDDSSR